MLFALAADAPLTDPHDKWLLGVFVIMAIAAIGMAMIVLLTVTWRRYNKRLDHNNEREPSEDTDIWREAAGRWRDEEPDTDDDDDDIDPRQFDR